MFVQETDGDLIRLKPPTDLITAKQSELLVTNDSAAHMKVSGIIPSPLPALSLFDTRKPLD